MLKELEVDQAQFVAVLAKAARLQRDKLLGHVAEEDLDGVQPARGEHNPAAALGFEPLPADAPQITALREAIDALSPTARCELYALMLIGQGQLGAKDVGRGTSEAHRLGEAAISAAIVDDVDLHDHLTKALYETGLVK